MTILLYDYRDLQERPPRHLKAWKAWHLVLYVLAAILGITNYVFLQKAMELVDHNCIVFPRELEFHYVKLSEAQDVEDFNGNQEFKNRTDIAQSEIYNGTINDDNRKVKRESDDNVTMSLNEVSTMDSNVTEATENTTHRLALDVSRTLFATDNCLFPEYMPLLSTVFAVVWLTMFTMCPSGGRARSGLTQPWRILAPALLFALVMVGLTGHSFTLTNGGIHAFCEDFFVYTNSTTLTQPWRILAPALLFALVMVGLTGHSFTLTNGGIHAFCEDFFVYTNSTTLTQPWRILAPALLFALVMVGLTGHSFTLTNGGIHAFCEDFFVYTNSTTCSAVDPLIELSWNASWGMSGRLGAARAASAGVWASWACAAALLLARCLAAPDFVVKRTSVYLASDPDKKIIPYLKKSHKQERSNQSSPNRCDNVSIKSEPTITTELVTASIEQGESVPTSLMATPVKTSTPRNTENIEMTYTPKERFETAQ